MRLGGSATAEYSQEDESVVLMGLEYIMNTIQTVMFVRVVRLKKLVAIGYTGALKAPVRCFGNHLSEKRKSLFQTDNKCGGAAILKNRTSRMGTPVGC